MKNEKVYKGATPMYVETNDIEHLTPFLCDNLSCGDIIQKRSDVDGSEHNYVVSYKKENEMCLTYCDHENVEEIYYEKGVNGWVFVQKDITKLGEGKDTRFPSLEGNGGKAVFVNEGEDGFEYNELPSNPLLSGSVVQVSTDGGATYGNGMSLTEFIAKCENGDYASNVGAIARITKLINGQTMRIRLIGVNHDVLANTDLGELEPNGTKAKTTWQFLDMPIQKVNLGLPYEEEKTGYIRSSQTDEDMSESGASQITIETIYPSNMHGYTSAVGLLNAMQEVYNALPLELQQAIKMVRKDCFISEIDDGDNFENFDTTATLVLKEQDRYGSCISAKLFCLSASELGMTHSTAENEQDQFPYDIEVEIDDEPALINLEGKKYAFFDSTPQNNQSEEARAKRVCYYNNEAYYYWLRSPCLLYSSDWGVVDYVGFVSDGSTYGNGGVAPAFCI